MKPSFILGLIYFSALQTWAQEANENESGFREKLATKGVEAGFVYSAMPVFNVKGGIERGARYIDNVDLTLNLNLEQLVGANGLSFFIYGLGNNGGFATELIGDVQTVSNIEAHPTWKLYELWAQQNFFKDQVSLLAGLYDINSEFDVVKPGLLFTHSSYGMGAELAQTGLNGPSTFPYTSLAARVAFDIKDRVNFLVAILDGVPGDPNDPEGTHIRLSRDEGALIMAQANINLGKDVFLTSSGSREAGTIRRKLVGRGIQQPNFNQFIIGAWRYTAAFRQLESEQFRMGNQGIYVAYQRYIYLNSERDKYFTGFLRLGLADGRFNRFSSALSGGLLYAVPFLGIPNQFGMAFSTAFNGNHYMRTVAANKKAETNIELTFSRNIKPFLAVQPSFQYVINPGTDPNLSNASVLLLLVQIEI
ncbi:MAG: carbohydrate porin [Cyclobacteriaceae bacterium]